MGAELDKKVVAKTLRKVGVLLELAGENPFKARAFDRAARAVETWDGSFAELATASAGGQVEGIGKGIAADLAELAASGRLGVLDDLEASFPAGLTDLLDISGLGPKTVRKLYEELGVTNIDALESACLDGRIAKLPRMGEKSVANILAGITHLRSYSGRFHLHTALDVATGVAAALAPFAERIEIAGSLRRRRETVKDIDLLAATSDVTRLADAFTSLPGVTRVTGKGETKCSVILGSGMACDLRMVDASVFGAALAHFTGSADHNVAMRRRAKSMGMKLSEYGLEREDGTRIPCPDERDAFEALGLAVIPPELREDLGEIDAAQSGALPALVESGELRGVLHAHTQYSDGTASIADMAAAARDLGFAYLGLADHSQSSTVAGGLKPDAVRRQHAEIDEFNAAHEFRVLKGIESDIRKDGSLDYDDDVLASFDFVIASVHSHFQMSRNDMTARVIRAARNPFTTMLGHPTGRLLLRREPYEIDMDAVVEACAESGCAIEINANPYRLDLDWRLVKKAIGLGVCIAICPDAHSTQQLAYSGFGVDIARKGWARSSDVLNTLDAEEFLTFAGARRNS
ncbi:MAG: DNA polymerase/3'-5' exonuclease PolX [Deltaproteobacteria bacterium]|nr:DNA polymerase/3'-5' exonuclease PolX [Deltaproteobacteria bacterium]